MGYRTCLIWVAASFFVAVFSEAPAAAQGAPQEPTPRESPDAAAAQEPGEGLSDSDEPSELPDDQADEAVEPAAQTTSPLTLEQQIDALLQQQERLEQRIAELEAGSGASDEDAALAAILEDVQSDAEDASPAMEPDSFRIYGFMDMGLQRIFAPEPSFFGEAPTGETTFVLGNVNLYFDFTPVEDWRGLVEVRFSLHPHGQVREFGSVLGSAYVREDAAIFDITDASAGFSTVIAGSVILERAQIDWDPNDWLTLRAGLFLTPFGIYNVDHGTPTLIQAGLPFPLIVNIFPRQQLGVMAQGVIPALPWELGYHLYVANGRLSTSQVDFTDNKTVGGRLFAKIAHPYTLVIGASGFVGWIDDQEQVITDVREIIVERRHTVHGREQGIGADLSLDVGKLRLRLELVARRVEYDEGRRALILDTFEVADHWEYGGYVIGAYRLPWHGLEPFVGLDLVRWPFAPLGEAVVIPNLGLNIHFNPAAQLKIQYAYAQFFDLEEPDPRAAPFGPTDVSNNYLHNLTARLVLAL